MLSYFLIILFLIFFYKNWKDLNKPYYNICNYRFEIRYWSDMNVSYR